jgi:hypothetical protein
MVETSTERLVADKASTEKFLSDNGIKFNVSTIHKVIVRS